MIHRFAEGKIDRIRRETIFFLYEGEDAAKWDLKRPHPSAARRLREQNAGKAVLPLNVRKAITYDHAIPLRCLRAGLRKASGAFDTMRAFLARHVKGVVIAREEDDRLTKLGLRSKMPDDSHPDDIMSRYRATEIDFDRPDIDIFDLD